MNDDQKYRFLLMMAVALTFLLVLQYVMPKQSPPPAPVAATQHGDRLVDLPAERTTPGAIATDVPAEAKEFNPSGDFTIKVRVGEEGKGKHGYEATFSSVGGGLASWRLLGFYRVPMHETPENEILLLNGMAPGRNSLRVDNVRYGAARQGMLSTSMRDERYELLEVPSWAEVTPEPGGEVKRGENLVFRAVVGDWEVRRIYRFPGHNGGGVDFTVKFDLEWRNISPENKLLSYNLVGPAGLVADDESVNFGVINFLTARQPAAASPSVEIERKAIADLVKVVPSMADRDNRGNLAWVGAKNRFFVAIMGAAESSLVDSNGATRLLFAGNPGNIPTAPDLVENFKNQPHVTTTVGLVPAFPEASLTVEPGVVPAGGTFKAQYQMYAGPAVDTWLTNADPRFEGVISYTISYLDFISRWMVRALQFLDGIFGNYGLAIIAMTIIIKALLHPLNRKSFVAMNKMSKLAPQMKEIQKKYAGDKVKMQMEMNKFSKENGLNMAGGCLPIFIQLPIFFALYGAFSQGFSMRHAPFLPPWIKDLSKPDCLYDLGTNIPFLNSSYISLLPILYFVLQYLQMSLQPKPTDPQQAQQQKIMKFMPLMFVFIFYSMPAGLVLYFTVSALCGVAENWYMRKAVLPKLGLGDAAPAGAGAEAGPAAAKAGAGAAVVPSAETKKRRRR